MRKLLKIAAIAAAALFLWTAQPALLAAQPAPASPAAAHPAPTPRRHHKNTKKKKSKKHKNGHRR